MARTILQKEGPRGFYAGISAAYARQIVYGSARLGLFRTFSNWFKDLNNGGAVPAYQKVLAGIGAGALGSFIGNPTELSLIRMQADATLPPAERRNYRGIFDAVRRIVAEEGVTGLWKGSSPTVVRAMALNVAMLATSDEVKERLAPHYSARATSVISAIISGVAASVASLPFDMIKTRLQKQKPGADGSLRYTGFLDCARKIAAEEGAAAFYTGLGTYITRIAPHAIVTLLVLDALNDAVTSYGARRAAAESQKLA